MEEWRQDFLNAALEIGRSTFAKLLDEETELWVRSQARWGAHEPGYKKDLARIRATYFEGSAPEDARRSVEDCLADAWTKMIVVEATRARSRAPPRVLTSVHASQEMWIRFPRQNATDDFAEVSPFHRRRDPT